MLWGSFLGVVAHRIPKRESIFVPRSHCDSCRRTLPWQELVPFKTWIIGGGKCVFCRSPLSLKILIPEVLTGLFFATIPFLGKTWQEMALYGLFFSFALPLSIIDFEHRRLPHALTLLAAITGLLSEWAFSRFSMDVSALAFPAAGYLAGFLPFAIISLLHPRGLGMGDAFWLGAIGTFVGPFGVLETLLLSTASATGSAVLYWIAKKRSIETGPLNNIVIPFGPFLSFGGIVTLIWGPSLTKFLIAIL